MLILGIDPGFDRLGWAVAQTLQNGSLNLLSFGLIATDKKQTIYERLAYIDQEMTQLLREFPIDQAALESLFYFRNDTTIVNVAQARGVVLSALLRAHVQIFEYSPPQIKLAVTGYGRADKKAIEKMVRLQFKLDDYLAKSDQSVLDDTYDALAVLLTHNGARGLQEKIKTA